MTTAPARRALVALATAAALLPAAPALAQTPTPTVTASPTPTVTASPTPTVTASPTPLPAPVPPQISVDRAELDVGGTLRLTVTGPAGAAVQLSGNGRQIRTATIPASGQFTWDLQPGDRTLFSAVVGGVRTETVTVRVRRTVSIGIRQDVRGVYTFTGQIQRAEAGVQVTIARLDSETGRVTGIASTATTADGRYEIRTSLPVGFAGYYALTGVNRSALEVGRSRLYGLIVNTRPGTPAAAQSISLGVRKVGESYVFSGTVTNGPNTPVTLGRLVDGRLVGVVGGRTDSAGRYSLSVRLAPGTSFFQVLTATATSRVYGLAVPARAPGAACSATAPRTSYEDSARCLFEAFVRNDRSLAANYATPAAVTQFLSWRQGSGDPGWTWDGCGRPILLTPSAGISCTYYDPPRASEVHGVTIELGMARDFRVEAVGSVG